MTDKLIQEKISEDTKKSREHKKRIRLGSPKEKLTLSVDEEVVKKSEEARNQYLEDN